LATVTKRSDGQAITVEISHDQPTQVDLTAIAGENFTLVFARRPKAKK